MSPRSSVLGSTVGGRATCPAGVTVTITAAHNARFGSACIVCLLRRRCTTAKDGRVLHLHPHHTLLAAARQFARSEDFDTVYRQHRPMAERTIAWLVRGANRELRYRGVARNTLWWSHRCAAINLQRLLSLSLTWNQRWAIA
jgi:Transposase DDE domain